VAKLPVPTVLELPKGMIRSGPDPGATPDAAEGEVKGATTLPLELGPDIVEASATAAAAAASRPRRGHRGRSGILHLLYCRSNHPMVATATTLRRRRAPTSGRGSTPVDEFMTAVNRTT
jgi:hypothetical protein